jgi:hypothetical protein
MTGDVIIQGRDWLYEPRGWGDVIRCLLGRHASVMIGRVDDLNVRRCSCGAINIGHGWFESAPFTRRKGDPAKARLTWDN